MRPALVAALTARGLPGLLVPDYVILVALSTLAAAALALRLARRDGAEVRDEARTILVAYVAAVAGGYLFEALRAVPAAIVARSLLPLVHVGRAAWGGLLFSAAAVALQRWRAGLPVWPFLDRAAIGTGLVFACVRSGCFLAGCDYGRPTASPLGVRFPAGSLAALNHAERGWVMPGSVSLPVHATQLYEALLGVAAAAMAAWALRGGRRDGHGFRTMLTTYALGRFTIEMLRGDETRGAWLGLSSAQWVSLAVLSALAARLLATSVPRWNYLHSGMSQPST